MGNPIFSWEKIRIIKTSVHDLCFFNGSFGNMSIYEHNNLKSFELRCLVVDLSYNIVYVFISIL